MLKTELSDSCLISLYKKGNEEALSTLISRHKSRIFTSIYLIVKDKFVAEDILQDVFIKIINIIKNHVDLSPYGIKTHLKLDQPIYEATSSYGHFGREYIPKTGSFSWEKTDLAEKILNEY